MRSKTLAELFSDLFISKIFSRTHLSKDNPFSKSMFKTIKYMPTFPDRFDSLQEARFFMRQFVKWYNEEHRHSGLAFHTPNDLHNGVHSEKKKKRDSVLAEAYSKNPIRFVKGTPSARAAPEAVWINKPRLQEKNMVGKSKLLSGSVPNH